MSLQCDIVNDQDVEQLMTMDSQFRVIHDKYGVPPNWSRPSGFVSLAKMILEQQVSLASARAHFLKLNNYIAEFAPKHILRLSDEEMRACQISRQKATYLRALSIAVMNGDIDFFALAQQPKPAVISQLTTIKGIGVWTAEVYLMFCLQDKDVFPMGDIALINTVRELWQLTDKEEIISKTEEWKPLRTLASYFLWHYYLRKRNRPSEVA
jgi:DNA-3-methyladenine glycosylase II